MEAADGRAAEVFFAEDARVEPAHPEDVEERAGNVVLDAGQADGRVLARDVVDLLLDPAPATRTDEFALFQGRLRLHARTFAPGSRSARGGPASYSRRAEIGACPR